MARSPSRVPTELELAILKILWERGPSTVRETREALAPERKLAHTSVMTVMGIMTEKGYLRRRNSKAGHVYSVRVSQERTLRQMLSDVVSRAFDGSALSAMLHLLDSSELSSEELARLRKAINEKKREDNA